MWSYYNTNLYNIKFWSLARYHKSYRYEFTRSLKGFKCIITVSKCNNSCNLFLCDLKLSNIINYTSVHKSIHSALSESLLHV